jgi:hypothetical protein
VVRTTAVKKASTVCNIMVSTAAAPPCIRLRPRVRCYLATWTLTRTILAIVVWLVFVVCGFTRLVINTVIVMDVWHACKTSGVGWCPSVGLTFVLLLVRL